MVVTPKLCASAARAVLWFGCAALTACGGGDAVTTSDPTQVPLESTAGAGERASILRVMAPSRPTPVPLPVPSAGGGGSGPGYFVDSVSGSDRNPGSFAQPWQSLAPLLGVTLRSGDAIYLRCASVWRETLALSSRQLVDSSVLSSYGDNCTGANKPRITGADDFSGSWTRSGNIWSRRVALNLPKISLLTVNAVLQRTAQWPNFAGLGREYSLAGSGSVPTFSMVPLSPADRQALSGKDIRGATVQVRTEPWLIENQLVDSIDQTGLRLKGSTNYKTDAADGFVLQDKLWMLDAPGEFFHDTAAGMLYVYPSATAAQADLNTALVEGTVRETALVVSGRANVLIQDVAVDMARTDGITINDAPGAVLDRADASNNVASGVRVNLRTAPAAPARGATVRNGRYLGNGISAIDAGNGVNVDFISNTVTKTGMGRASGSNAALIAGDGALVKDNVIEESAFRGILFSGFGGTKITGNIISEYCLRLSDCAAIYTVNGANRQSPSQLAAVEGNQITGGVLNVEGTTGGKLLAAIYLDDKSRGLTVRGNMLSGMPIGIFVHNSSNNIIEGNRIWLTTDAGLLVSMDNATTDLLTGNLFRANQLAPSSSVAGVYPALPQIRSSQAFRFLHAIQGQGAIVSGQNIFTGNQLVSFNGDTDVMADVGFTASQKWLKASEWMALNPGELAPSSPATYVTYRSTLGPELIPGGGFDGGLGLWSTWFMPQQQVAGSVAVVTGMSGCIQQCIWLAAGSVHDRLSSPAFRMSAGSQYLISFTAGFSGIADIAHPNIARLNSPFESFVDAQGLRTKVATLSGRRGDVIQYEAFFTANSGETARVNLRTETPGVGVAFDSISLRPVTGYVISNFSDWGAVVSAPASQSRTLSCEQLSWPVSCSVIDVDGNAVQMPVVVPAGNSKLLLLANSTWRR